MDEIIYKTDVQTSGHSIEQSLTHANPMNMTYNSAPILMFFLIVLYRIIGCIWGGEEEESEDD